MLNESNIREKDYSSLVRAKQREREVIERKRTVTLKVGNATVTTNRPDVWKRYNSLEYALSGGRSSVDLYGNINHNI